MPRADQSMAAPNGCAKLIIPYENSLTSIADGRVQVSHEHGLYFVGNRDTSTSLQSASRKTGFIAIEFRPFGAYAIFGVPMNESVNRLLDSDEIFGHWGRTVKEVLCNTERVEDKLSFIQEQLLRQLRQKRAADTVIEFSVNALKQTAGRMPIRELERRTGYSRRYLDRLFQRHVGLSPKMMAEIFRFQRFYKLWALGAPFDTLRDEVYEYYYDQSHFTKEFKRMTGYSPQKFANKVSNEFGRRIIPRTGL
jgi:AraC-like DNA-binding protein